jgi:hypothetical protein
MVVTAKGAPDDSPEARFARAFTAHYEAISRVLPEFARLSKLAKLSEIFNFAASVRARLETEFASIDKTEETRAILERYMAELPDVPRDQQKGCAYAVNARLLVMFPRARISATDCYILLSRREINDHLLEGCSRAAEEASIRDLRERIESLRRGIGGSETAPGAIPAVPALYQFGQPARAFGEVILKPKLTQKQMSSQDLKAFSSLAMHYGWKTANVGSLFGGLLRDLSGNELLAGSAPTPQEPEDINIVLTEQVTWEPLPGRPAPVTGQITLLAIAQEHIFEYRKKPSGIARDISWQCRMDRVANEVRWEIANLALLSDRTESYQRSQRIVAERGYELEMDTKHGLVLGARELGVKEWDACRESLGSSPSA